MAQKLKATNEKSDPIETIVPEHVESELEIGQNEYSAIEEYNQLSDEEKTMLKDQAEAEYKYSYDSMLPKIQTWLLRMKLYNNQKRDPNAVGDPLFFTTFQTVLASLYVDRLTSEWLPREEGDNNKAEILNKTAEFDQDEMLKDETDFYWIWDSCFFGRGIVGMMEYDRDLMIPIIENWDPITFRPDPRSSSINGIGRKKTGKSRFFGREVEMTKYSMEENGNYFYVDYIEDNARNPDDVVKQARDARAEAQGRQQERMDEPDINYNKEYHLIEWYTHFRVDGQMKKILCSFTDDFKICVRFQILGDVSEDWPILDRPLYPTSKVFWGVSIGDLVEDKQRMRAVTTNLMVQGLKADLYPMYVFDETIIKNRADLANFEFNKMIPAEGGIRDAIAPINKARVDIGMVNYVLDTLDMSAQRATATPELQQGVVSDNKRTLGELNLVASRVTTRYSLSAKIFGWSERALWLRWYKMHKEHFDLVDEKLLRINGAYGANVRLLTRDEMIYTENDPDVMIDSQALSRARKLEERALFNQFIQFIAGDPDANLRYGLKKAGKLHGLSKEEVDRILPPTIEEMRAEAENEKLTEDEEVRVNPDDDHRVHLEVHAKSKDTPQKYAHIETHKEALRLQRTQPELFPNLPATQAQSQGGLAQSLLQQANAGRVGTDNRPATAESQTS